MDKILSIVIPTYNMEKYLDKCLTSLILPDDLMKSLEVLVINDGSKDSSSAIAHGYQEKYPQTFRVIDKENRHYGSCVNRGLYEATGKYIKILDADDYFENKSLFDYLNLLKTTDADVIVTDYVIVDSDYKRKEYVNFDFPENEIRKIEDLCESVSWKTFQMHAITYRRSVLVDNGYRQTEGVPYTDQEWCFLPVVLAKDFVYFHCPVYQYLIGREGQSINRDVLKRSARIMWNLTSKRINLFHDLCQNKSLSDAKVNYMHHRILSPLKLMYKKNILINYYDNDDLIREIDSSIRVLSPSIYEDIGRGNGAHFLSYNYVDAWRKNKKLIVFLRIILIPIAKLRRKVRSKLGLVA